MTFEHLDLGDFTADYAILTGNPKRVERLAANFHEPVFVSDRRGLDTWHARLADGDERGVFLVGTGMGSPTMAIVQEELMAAGVHTLMRIGTCGSLRPEIVYGDLIVSMGVVRDEGTTRAYIREDFPAVPHYDMIIALDRARRNFDWPVHAGITHAKDAFYTQKPEFSLDPESGRKHWRILRDAGVIGTEMESSVLYILATLRRCRALALLVTSGVDRTHPRIFEGLEKAAELAKIIFRDLPPFVDERTPRNIRESVLDSLKGIEGTD